MASLFLLFSHNLTPEQQTDALQSLGVQQFHPLPADLQARFSNVPPELDDLHPYAEPLCDWLKTHAHAGDFALVQGDFGLVFLLVRYCQQIGVTPVYATTERQSLEVQQADGSIVTQRVFRHKKFRTYTV